MFPFDDILTATQAVYNSIVGIPMTIAGILAQLLNCLLYPVVVAFDCLTTIINTGIAPPLQLANVIISVPNVGITIINLLFVGVFPSIWVALIIASMMIMVGLRLYAIVKGASILGFSL